MRGGKYQRRKHNQKNEIRTQRNIRHRRQETQDEAAEHENNGIRLADPSRQRRQSNHKEQQQQHQQLDVVDID